MSFSDGETQSLLEVAWKRTAKGRPLRWRILRDCVAVLSLGWMSTSQVQIAMRRLWALKNRTTRDILEELEMEKAIIQEKDEKDQIYKWGSTPSGVKFWIGTTQHIPVGIAEVALTSLNVNVLEV